MLQTCTKSFLLPEYPCLFHHMSPTSSRTPARCSHLHFHLLSVSSLVGRLEDETGQMQSGPKGNKCTCMTTLMPTYNNVFSFQYISDGVACKSDIQSLTP